MAGSELVCEKDGQATRLTCAKCERPICPQCLVRTPVGLKCATCGTGTGRTEPRRAVWLVPLGIVVIFAVIVVPQLTNSSDEPSLEAVPRVPDPEVPARYARIGTEARDGDMAFTVTTFDCGATTVEGGPVVRRAQGTFCFMAVDLKNNGRMPVTFIARAQMLQDLQSREFGPDMAATSAHPANTGRDLGSVVINPGNALQGVIVFDVPPDADPVVAAFRAGPHGPGAFVTLRSS